jgi:hypothetical protein
MENFNSLGFFYNSLNKLCRKYNIDILAGCKTQADWRQATVEQQFQNLIGVGMDRGCTGEFPPRRKKTPLCSTYAKNIWRTALPLF